MRNRLVLLTALFGLSLMVPTSSQERITLSSPETVPDNLTYRVQRLTIESDDPATVGVDEGIITIQLIGVERATPVTCIYRSTTNPTGTFLSNALNKANLSSTYANNATTGSLIQRIFHRLFSGGLNEAPQVCGRSLTGTLTGGPQ